MMRVATAMVVLVFSEIADSYTWLHQLNVFPNLWVIYFRG